MLTNVCTEADHFFSNWRAQMILVCGRDRNSEETNHTTFHLVYIRDKAGILPIFRRLSSILRCFLFERKRGKRIGLWNGPHHLKYIAITATYSHIARPFFFLHLFALEILGKYYVIIQRKDIFSGTFKVCLIFCKIGFEQQRQTSNSIYRQKYASFPFSTWHVSASISFALLSKNVTFRHWQFDKHESLSLLCTIYIHILLPK